MLYKSVPSLSIFICWFSGHSRLSQNSLKCCFNAVFMSCCWLIFVAFSCDEHKNRPRECAAKGQQSKQCRNKLLLLFFFGKFICSQNTLQNYSKMICYTYIFLHLHLIIRKVKLKRRCMFGHKKLICQECVFVCVYECRMHFFPVIGYHASWCRPRLFDFLWFRFLC